MYNGDVKIVEGLKIEKVYVAGVLRTAEKTVRTLRPAPELA